MKFTLIHVGKTTEEYIKDGVAVYMKRLQHYMASTEIFISPSKEKERTKALLEEEKLIRRNIMPGDFIIILDEAGKEFTSAALAEKFEKWMVQGITRIVFITGGAYGISSSLKKSSSFMLSLSKMTFTHQMVRLILAEQLYRAMTIIKKEGYHHE